MCLRTKKGFTMIDVILVVVSYILLGLAPLILVCMAVEVIEQEREFKKQRTKNFM